MDEERISPFQWEEEDKGSEKKVAIRIVIYGKVQGVGYRNWLRSKALDHHIDGWVRNRSDGQVEALLCGLESQVKEVISLCFQGPPAAAVRRVKEFPETGMRTQAKGFMSLPTI